MGGDGSPVETDETFVGGRSKFMHKSKRKVKITGGGAKDKTPVMGLLERHSGKKHSTVRAVVLDGKVDKASLHAVIHKNVQQGAQIFTDAYRGYDGLSAEFIHRFIDHAEKYVDGVVHTNGIENFWALFKRCIKGTHVSIEPFHLAAYVDAEAFRFNNRTLHDGQRFALALQGMIGKRLTYKALTGALEGTPGNDKDAENGNLPN
jgi:transposase-like protein